MRAFMTVAIAGLLAATANAQTMYRCGSTLQDRPCDGATIVQPREAKPSAQAPKPAAKLPDASQPGLWERRMVIYPRYSHKGEEFAQRFVSKICSAESYIAKEHLWRIDHECKTQIARGGGICVVDGDWRPTGQQGNEEKRVFTYSGNYRTELRFQSDYYLKSPQLDKPVNDRGIVDIRFLGPCPAGMKAGTEIDETPAR